MTDCHVHIHKGPYTIEWIDEFVKVAQERGINEIYLLDHCYHFSEFAPMYKSVCDYSEYIKAWLSRHSGVSDFEDYLRLANAVRSNDNPIKIKFGLEICYFKEFEDLVYDITKGKELDFLVGSVHFIDNFAFDHKPEFWDGVDVDKTYRRYFEISIDLANSGIYSGIAHPDALKLYGHKPSFSLLDYYDKLAEVLAKNNMYAEQSGGIFNRGTSGAELGMNTNLLSAMKNHNVKILTASDAHCPEDVGVNIAELQAML
jgi:histidinol-phosphatase (PHP family)